MPWIGLEHIPILGGTKFLSSTCAGNEFMNFNDNRPFTQDSINYKYKHKVSYIGGLS